MSKTRNPKPLKRMGTPRRPQLTRDDHDAEYWAGKLRSFLETVVHAIQYEAHKSGSQSWAALRDEGEELLDDTEQYKEEPQDEYQDPGCLLGEPPRPKLTRKDKERIRERRIGELEEEVSSYKDRWTTACVENERLTRRVAEMENEAEGGNSVPENPADGITPRERAEARGRKIKAFCFRVGGTVRLWSGMPVFVTDPVHAEEKCVELNRAFVERFLQQIGEEEEPLPGMKECPVCGIGRITEAHAERLKVLEGQAMMMQARNFRPSED